MEEVRAQLLEAMGFSRKAIGILDKNLNMGILKDPSIKAQHEGSCGDILMLSLKIENRIISDAKYEYIGCAGLQACASAMTELIKGQEIENAVKLDIDDIITYLERIPDTKIECAEIARDTLRKALKELT
jgi:nitrogen fixation NifU-like protein